MTLNYYEGLYYGRADTMCRDILDVVTPNWPESDVLLATIDSGHAPSRLGRLMANLKSEEASIEAIGDYIWMPASAAERLLRMPGLLVPFCEVYLLNGRDKMSTNLQLGQFTAERSDFASTLPQQFIDGFRSLNAWAFFADGTGLNFVTSRVDVCGAVARADAP